MLNLLETLNHVFIYQNGFQISHIRDQPAVNPLVQQAAGAGQHINIENSTVPMLATSNPPISQQKIRWAIIKKKIKIAEKESSDRNQSQAAHSRLSRQVAAPGQAAHSRLSRQVAAAPGKQLTGCLSQKCYDDYKALATVMLNQVTNSIRRIGRFKTFKGKSGNFDFNI